MHGLNKKFSDLFAEAFLTNSELEQTDVTEEDRRALTELLPVEIYEHLKELIQELLQFKRKALCSEKFQLLKQNKLLKASLQRLQVAEHVLTEPQGLNPLFRTTHRRLPKKALKTVRKAPAERQLRTGTRQTLVQKFARPLRESGSVKRHRKYSAGAKLS